MQLLLPIPLPMRSPDQTLKHVGNKIKERRKQLGYSQAKLAARVGFDSYIVSRIENGHNCRLSTLLLILRTLELELVLI
jgi:transcriptional regulator with XRE-family HTH domain